MQYGWNRSPLPSLFHSASLILRVISHVYFMCVAVRACACCWCVFMMQSGVSLMFLLFMCHGSRMVKTRYYSSCTVVKVKMEDWHDCVYAIWTKVCGHPCMVVEHPIPKKIALIWCCNCFHCSRKAFNKISEPSNRNLLTFSHKTEVAHQCWAMRPGLQLVV